MPPKKILIDGNSLRIEDVVAVARGNATVALSPAAKKRMQRSRAWVEKNVRDHSVVYGVTTGFGAFQNVSIAPEKIKALQRNLIVSHCAGVGEPFPEEVVRAMMLLRTNALAKGFSGIRVSTVETLLSMLKKRVHPVIPSQGSVGASGDLAPLSHMAAVLIGEGEAFYKGSRMPGSKAMKAARITPVVLEAKEGLSLNNGTQAMTAIGVLALNDAERLCTLADAAAAMSLECLKGRSTPFAPAVQALRPHPGQALSAMVIRKMIKGSRLVDVVDDDTRGKVQDSYSIRCAPQVHGASRDAVAHVRRVLQTEINSATDNPLIIPSLDKSFSAGNFHGQPVAMAMDCLSLALASLGNISERRIAKLLDKNHNFGLPHFLTVDGGVHTGLMISQYTAAALVSENKVLIHPASGDSIPTSANQEDHVSMGAISARHAARILDNVEHIVAIELICAAQGIDFRRVVAGKGTTSVYDAIRKHVPPLQSDRALTGMIEKIVGIIRSGEIFKSIPS